MNVLILGAGGTGGYYGGRLAQAGVDVTFLVRAPRAADLRSRGLEIRSPKGDATVPIKVVTAAEISAPYDTIILSCKAYDLDSSIEAIRPAVGANTLIIPLLNGLRHLDRLDQEFGAAHVLGGVAYISASKGPNGEILHLSPLSSLSFGARQPRQQAACEQIAALFAAASFESRASTEILQDMWEKFVFLTTLASMTCMMRGTIGDILAGRDGQQLLFAMLEQNEAVAAASGYPVRDGARQRTRQMLSDTASNMTASMLRDIQTGAPIEADAVVGDMVERASVLGLPPGPLGIAYIHLQVYERQRQARQGNA